MADGVRDLALDLDTGDLVFDGKDLALVAGVEAVAQEARIALSLFAGEWFLDLDAGARWHEIMGIKAPDSTMRAAFESETRRVLGLVQGLASVDFVTVARDGARVGTITVG